MRGVLFAFICAVIPFGQAISAARKKRNGSCTARETTTPLPKEDSDWRSFQQKLRVDAAAAAAAGAQVVFYGDSITEAFRGTSLGAQSSRAEGIPAVWAELFAPLRAVALAISGDQTQHLLWRISEAGGELPDALQPRVFAVAIGTNNLGSRGLCDANATLAGVRAVLRALRARRPKAKLLVLGLLPRGTEACRIKPSACASGATLDGNPFTEPLRRINRALSAEPGVTFIRGWDLFVSPGTSPSSKTGLTQGMLGRNATSKKKRGQLIIPQELMGDYLHPTAVGTRRWALRIKEVIDRLIATP